MTLHETGSCQSSFCSDLVQVSWILVHETDAKTEYLILYWLPKYFMIFLREGVFRALFWTLTFPLQRASAAPDVLDTHKIPYSYLSLMEPKPIVELLTV